MADEEVLFGLFARVFDSEDALFGRCSNPRNFSESKGGVALRKNVSREHLARMRGEGCSAWPEKIPAIVKYLTLVPDRGWQGAGALRGKMTVRRKTMRIRVPSVFRIRVAAAPALDGETESTDQRPPARALALLWRRSAKDIRRPKDLRGSGDTHLYQRLLDDIGVAWWEVHVNAPKRPWR